MYFSTQDLNQSPTWEPVTRLAYCHFGQLVSLVKYVCIDIEYDQLGCSYSIRFQKTFRLKSLHVVYLLNQANTHTSGWLIRPNYFQYEFNRSMIQELSHELVFSSWKVTYCTLPHEWSLQTHGRVRYDVC